MTAEQPVPDHPGLSGTQTVAVLLMQIPPVGAASLMAQFSESEAQEIAAEIGRLRRVSSSVADSVVSDFHDYVASGKRTARGGRNFAAGLLEASCGAEKATGLMGRVTSSMAGKSFDFSEWNSYLPLSVNRRLSRRATSCPYSPSGRRCAIVHVGRDPTCWFRGSTVVA